MPVARARNVLPIHGSAVAVSSLTPADPVQPAPYDTADAGHVEESVAKRGDATPPRVAKPPPIAIWPCGRTAIVAGKLVPVPGAVQVQLAPFHRPTYGAVAPIRRKPPASRSPFGSTANAGTNEL